MFQIKKLEFKNILSFGNELKTIDFTFDSLLISGMNGHGKSAVLESIYYCLYGKPYRNITMAELVNNINKKELYTKLTFVQGNSEYMIERGQSPNILNLYKDGAKINTEISKSEFQKTINKIIGVDNKIFNQLVMVDSKFYKPFMELPLADKRFIVDNIFGLDLISDMMDKVKEYKVKIEEKIIDSSRTIEITKEKISLNKKYAEENKQAEIQTLKESIEKNNEALLSFNNDFEIKKEEFKKTETSINTQRQIMNDMPDVASGLLSERLKFEIQISNNNQRIAILKTGKCDKCGHAFINAAEEIVYIEIDTSNLKSQHGDIIKQIEEQNKKRDDAQTIFDNIKDASSDLKKQMDTLSSRTREIINDNNNLRSKINKLTDEKQKDNNVIALESELEISNKGLAFDKSMLNKIKKGIEILSDNGIRSYIMKKYLPLFNQLIKKYLEIMEASFSFSFDESFEQIVSSKYRSQNISYPGFSSGQKSRVNLAILFSLMEFAENKSNQKFNFLILDEIIDSANLDHNGKELILSIIKNHLKDKKIICISHDSQLNSHFQKELKISIKGSFSKMEII